MQQQYVSTRHLRLWHHWYLSCHPLHAFAMDRLLTFQESVEVGCCCDTHPGKSLPVFPFHERNLFHV